MESRGGRADTTVSDATGPGGREAVLRERLAMDAALDGIAILDEQARYVYLNHAHLGLFGFDHASELIGSTWKRLYDEAEIGRIERDVFPVLLRDGRWAGEAVALRRDGTRFAEGLSLTVLEGGGLICVCRDNTAAKRAAEEHARLGAIVESSDDAIISKNLDGFITTWNAAAERMFGYSAADAIGQPITLIVPQDRLEEETTLLSRLRLGEHVDYIETQRLTRDGRLVDVSLTVSPLRNAEGHIVGASKIARDITERKRSEDALRESEERLRLIVDHGEYGLWALDSATGQTYTDERWWRILGYEPDERPSAMALWESSLHPEDKTRVMAAVAAHEGGDTPRLDVEYRARTKSGMWIWLNTRARVQARDAEGRAVRVMGTIHDVSARKEAERERERLEAQLRHAQRLESLGVLAGGIAHDFNNLLMVILGNTTLALDELPVGAVSIETRLRAVETASTRASDLRQQMLAYAGKRPVERRVFSLADMVSETTTLLGAVVSKKADLQLQLEPVAVEGDAAQLQQVVMNLVTNASEALGDRAGVVRVHSHVRRLDAGALQSPFVPETPAAGQYAVLEVEDSGEGIAAEALPRIFDPFYSTRFTGRGLGLAAVLGIVRSHRGTITVDSVVGRGTTVRVFIPVAQQTPAATADSPTARSGLGQGTVLVVDDEAMVREYVGSVLTRAGFNVIEAAHGMEALTMFDQHPDRIAAVLLDLTMSKMDGIEVLRELRTRRPNVRVLLMSGHAPATVRAQLAGSAATDLVQKPIGARELLERINRLISSAPNGPSH